MRRLTAAGLLLASAAAIASRRPDVFSAPQFWAEDGFEWYARAYNDPGIANLIAPYGGYLQLFPRIAGWLSQAVPFAQAPLLMAILALAVQAIAPVFLLTDRFAGVVPSRAVRWILAILVIAVHASGHLGGLNVVRAAAGKQQLFVPSKELREY